MNMEYLLQIVRAQSRVDIEEAHVFIGPHLTDIMAQPLKRSRHAEVTADIRQEEAAKQSQSIEDGHLAPVQTSLVSGEGHPTRKSSTSHYVRPGSDSVITRSTHRRCLQPDNRRRSRHCDVGSDSRSNMVDNSIQSGVCAVHHDFNFQILELSICWTTSTDNVKGKELKSSSLCTQVG